MNNTNEKVQQLQNEWKTNPRWAGVKRTYTAEEVIKLKPIIITLAEIQGKLALGSKEMVASGIGDSINKLVEQVKSL